MGWRLAQALLSPDQQLPICEQAMGVTLRFGILVPTFFLRMMDHKFHQHHMDHSSSLLRGLDDILKLLL